MKLRKQPIWKSTSSLMTQWVLKGANKGAFKWENLNITAKFNVAFGGLLALLLLVSGTSYLFLSIVYRQTEVAIFTSTEIQRRILEMDTKLQTARVHERDFFLRYPVVGFTEAQQNYASKAVSHIAEVIKLSKELEQLIQSSNVSDTLQKQNLDLARYFLFSERYKNTFLDAVEIATQLAGEDDGLWGHLDAIANQLSQRLSANSNVELMTLYHKMRTFEKDYQITHEVTSLQLTLNVAFDLHQGIDNKTGWSLETKNEIHSLLSKYENIFRDIEDLDQEIQQRFRDFELQAKQVDPVSAELIRLSREEVERTQLQILQTKRWANTSLGTTVIIGLLLASIIARILNISITRRVITLNQAVEELEGGNLDIRTKIVNRSQHPDELGRLSQSFNKMADQLQANFRAIEATNDQLEYRVHERTVELSDALKKLQSTQTQLVQTEKMSSLGQMVAGVAHEINNPVSFIHGNISPAYEYIGELTELLNLYQIYYPNPNPIIQEYIEEIDLEFVQQDLLQLLDSMKEGSNRIREIVKSLRVFSRVDEAEFKNVDLHTGLDSTLMLLRNRLKHANKDLGIEVVKQYGDIPLINCYPGQLNQVFMNIISNAIDALETCNPQLFVTHNGAKNDQIKIYTQVFESDWVLIKISDNGPGLSDDVKEKLFDPFFTTKPVGKGTGLGLSVSYQIIVERHRGKLWCDSYVGEGTTFNIQIPITQMDKTR
ncbi:MAG: ATP-binding protein [Cyanobacteria bacterium P01_F01_bin.150]